MASFICASLFPAELGTGLALATARAGGIGLLDCEICPPQALQQSADNLRQLLDRLRAEKLEGRVGLRLAASQVITHEGLAESLAEQPHHIILCGWSGYELPELFEKLKNSGRQIWLEIRAGDEIALADSNLPFHGWVARGSECGGRSGRESAFILSQHLARQDRPFLVQGGIGPHSAAACRVAGATGVILDDALLLLRESPLSASRRILLERLDVQDTTSEGGAWRNPYRFVDRGDFPAGRELRRRAEQIAAEVPEDRQESAWSAAVLQMIGMGDPQNYAWPLGQAAGRASDIARRYGTVGRLVRAVIEESARHIQTSAALRPLAPDGPLARSHQTRFPIVQGPMTRVSDSVSFAAAVAENGALPLFALALMRAQQIERLLEEAKQTMGERPWGVGILGFVPPELRQEQLQVVEKVRPPFALIAGGRPDQALYLESYAIPTYLHVPTPQLLRLFIEQGARRFVFEGGECGGHVGPLSSFTLWESAIDILLSDIPAGEADKVHVVFAGGIHDARSAAMVTAMAAPLAERNMKIGVLMGSAYLFTEEAVESGAIAASFQTKALRCEQTAIIETRPGHKIRCAPTPFVTAFEQKRARLRHDGWPSSETGDELEKMLVGRLRIASKGLEGTGDQLQPLDAEQQHTHGLYMMGQLAALRSSRTRCGELHEEVSVGGTTMIAAASQAISQSIADASRLARGSDRPLPVAIIGIGCLLPGAHDAETLWRNLLDKLHTIREIPNERWDWRLYYDQDPTARDKIYSRWGGFLDPAPFDPLHFGIPPNSLPSISLPQLLALETTRLALCDAGYGSNIADERLRERTAVFMGAANSGDLEQLYKTRSALPLCVPGLGEDTFQRLPEWTEESYPGILVNVIAGRISNRFDLGGPNFTIDAACASSLAALDMAVRELRSGSSDLVLAGGIEFEQSPQAYMAFSKTRALSPRGRARVFDEGADGIVLSEGAVVLALKRLADAERDGDRVYAVIHGVAGSSDGKGMGLTAPKPAGQLRALKRAHEMAGTDPGTLGLYEAHATGTAVGDRAEIETITNAMQQAGAPPRACAIGSAKSLLGHTRAAAGMVGLVKTALAIYHRTLPPHAGAENPFESLRRPDSQIYLLDEPCPWLADPHRPRRAGVSAFGFGGTNFHAVVEEYDGGAPGLAATGADIWPCELFVVAAAGRDSLIDELDRLNRAAEQVDGHRIHLRDLAFSAAAARGVGNARVALVAASAAELREKISATKRWLESGGELPQNVFAGFDQPPGELAFLFPGQGAQYPGMGAELGLYFREARDVLELADGLLSSDEPLSRLILPPAPLSEQERARQAQALSHTRTAQPAIAVISCAMLDLARRLGLEPARTAGHSFGEYVALHAAGVLGREDLLRLSEARGQILADFAGDGGAMAAVSLSREEIEPYLAGSPDVCVANYNAPRQVVLSGQVRPLEELLERLRADGHSPLRLSVSAAFHSPLMRPARSPLETFLSENIRPGLPQIPVHANLDGEAYPESAEAILSRLVEHLEQPVNFLAQIESMYKAGVRTFVELGPGHVLSGLVKQALGKRPHLMVSVDSGLRAWLCAVARIYAGGHKVKVEALFNDRPVRLIDFDQLPAKPASVGWLIDGGRVRRADDRACYAGKMPFLNQDDRSLVARSPLSPLPHESARTDAGVEVLTSAYREYQETMRQFLDQQERMLTQILAGSANPAAAPEARPEPPRPAALAEVINTTVVQTTAAQPPNGNALDRQRLTKQLIAIVSERTGYQADMLDPEQDLEAELGIDSIKRIEILTKLLKALPPEFADRARIGLDRLTRAKSLKNMVGMIMRETAELRLEGRSSSVEFASSVSSSVSSVMPSAARSESHAEHQKMRAIVVDTEKALLRVSQKRLEGLYLVTEDSAGVAPLVVAALKRAGAPVGLISRQELLSLDTIEQRVLILREVYGPVRGILHLASLGLEADSPDISSWRQATSQATKNLFRLIQLCAQELDNQSNPMRLLAVSQLGGNWGRKGIAKGSPAGGGSYGLLRSLEREYPHILTKVIDFDDAPASDMADRILDEVIAAGGGEEIGYVNGRRIVFSTQSAPLTSIGESHDWRPREGWVVLVTGGARGITAEVCRELARPGVRLIVVGRSPEFLSDHEASEPPAEPLWQSLLANLAGQNITLPPADTEATSRQKELETERRQNLEALRESGAEVEYHAVDVRSAKAFGGLIDDIYNRYGRLDAVVHGAGIIEDRQVVAKDYGSFERVFDTKADSTFILSRRLRPEGLKWVVLFSSISGRYGNPGQCDYAAANETVNRLAWQMDVRWPDTRVVSINWGPWSGTGMATEGALGLLEAKGIVPIDPATGRLFFVDELTHGRKGEVEVIAGKGPWTTETDQLLSSVFEASFFLLQMREVTELIEGAD